jgi:hypothetical protein
VGLLLQLHVGWLLLVDRMNPALQPGALTQRSVEVLRARKRATHLQARLPDGSERSMEFPASSALLGSTHMPLPDGEWDSLPACMGYVLGTLVRWVQGDARFRTWELHCGPVHRVCEEFRTAYAQTLREARTAHEWHGGLVLLATLVVLVLEHRASRRRGWA